LGKGHGQSAGCVGVKDVEFVNGVFGPINVTKWFPCVILIQAACPMNQIFESFFLQSKVNDIIYFVNFLVVLSDINQIGLDNRLARQSFFIGFDPQDIQRFVDFHAPRKSKLNCIGAHHFHNGEQT